MNKNLWSASFILALACVVLLLIVALVGGYFATQLKSEIAVLGGRAQVNAASSPGTEMAPAPKADAPPAAPAPAEAAPEAAAPPPYSEPQIPGAPAASLEA